MSQQISYNSLIKILLLGNRNVGKTSIMNQMLEKFNFDLADIKDFDGYFTIKVFKTNYKNFQVQIFDPACEENLCSLLSSDYYKNADACILIYDITKRASFENDWLTIIKRVINSIILFFINYIYIFFLNSIIFFA